MLQEKGGAHGDGSKIAYEDLLNFFREDRVNTRLLSTDLDEDAEEEEEEEPAEVMPARVRRKMERERIKQVMQQSLANRQEERLELREEGVLSEAAVAAAHADGGADNSAGRIADEGGGGRGAVAGAGPRGRAQAPKA